MIEQVGFQNSKLFWPVAVIALLLWLLFLWKEYKKPVKAAFYLNGGIALITILSFALLVLKPLRIEVLPSNAAVLLTDRFNQKQLDSLKESHTALKVMHYERNVPIESSLDSLSHLFILGNGVESFDFWQFEDKSVDYLSGKLPTGIIDLKYESDNEIGQPLIINGRYHKATPNHQLVLEDGNGIGLDSIILIQQEFQKFTLNTKLKATGRFVFELVEKDSVGKVINRNPIPFEVVERKHFKILIVNAFPSFETKYLKNYMAEMGHEIVVRSQLTRGRYKFEYFNTERKPIYRIGEKELKPFDLLIIDGRTLMNLSSASRSSLEKSIKINGLGVFIQPELRLLGKPLEGFGLEFEQDKISRINLGEWSKQVFEKYPYTFKTTERLEEIHQVDSTIVTAYRRMEQGRVGTTLIQESYRLQLEGKMKIYREFWSSILGKLVRKDELQSEWGTAKRFPLINVPFRFELRSSLPKPELLTKEGGSIVLQRNIDISTLWTGTTYPKEKGWNQLRFEKDSLSVLNFYVFDESNWPSLRAQRTRKANIRLFSDSVRETEPSSALRAIEPLWFFLMGLLGMGYLWLHPKLFRN